MQNNHWYAVKNQSLAIYSRSAGFDLAMYETYDQRVKAELRKRAVEQALIAIQLACSDQKFDVASIKKGVYVIALSNPLSIGYRYKRSQVIYIGRGNILGRIKSHFEKKLFDFMLSLSGADFDFYFARPARAGTANYFKHAEHLMLDYFTNQYGGIDDKRRFPILNKNAGNNQYFSEGSDWWKKPLKAIGHRPLWELWPTNFGDFPPLDE
ncbi:hypothetical protein J2W34_000265 [Variovorax boronicumulans]|uniref:hypothetical protein n=1 Tax=Variovorax boronicumulans TaxID=436515 RepID=UPI002782F42F|nr:hypothetical protein [Variovorax boronicumulans]MDQ0068491.1 hypothetical protein [Variovorax boronicumulans]